jgi:hypothetical protein
MLLKGWPWAAIRRSPHPVRAMLTLPIPFLIGLFHCTCLLSMSSILASFFRHGGAALSESSLPHHACTDRSEAVGEGCTYKGPVLSPTPGPYPEESREVCLPLREAVPHRGGKTRLPRDHRHIRSVLSGIQKDKGGYEKISKP